MPVRDHMNCFQWGRTGLRNRNKRFFVLAIGFLALLGRACMLPFNEELVLGSRNKDVGVFYTATPPGLRECIPLNMKCTEDEKIVLLTVVTANVPQSMAFRQFAHSVSIHGFCWLVHRVESFGPRMWLGRIEATI
eukprot:COSAG01_NODE_33611_length_561_cov_1.480519_1_plen_134_part_01